MLDERKAAILRAVVQEYIRTASPVGSSHVAARAGLAVSSATVRAEMAGLEREGYLVQRAAAAALRGGPQRLEVVGGRHERRGGGPVGLGHGGRPTPA